MDNRELKLSSKTITFTLVSRAAQAVGSLLLLFLTARWGGAQVRGEISVLLATLTLVSHLASWVGGGTLVYWVNRHSPRHLFYLAMAWSLGVSLFLWISVAHKPLWFVDLYLLLGRNARFVEHLRSGTQHAGGAQSD